jgi:hypothetical protein
MHPWQITAIALLVLIVLGAVFGYRKLKKDFGARGDRVE